MKKAQLINFLHKYHLNGVINSAKISCKDGTLNCNFVSDDHSNVGYVSMGGFELEDFELCVYTTSELLKILNSMNEDIKLKVITNTHGVASSLSIVDKRKSIKYMLADLSTVEDAPELDKLPDFEIKIKITSDFMEDFIKLHGALKESGDMLFGINSDGKSTKIIMNYSNNDTNKAVFKADTVDGEHSSTDGATIVFSADFFKAVVMANKGFDSAVFEVSTEGFGRIVVEDETFSGKYYLLSFAG